MASSSSHEIVPLWEHKRDMPYSRGSGAKDIPVLSVFLPKSAAIPAPAIIICPGGGYGFRVDDFEGSHVAEWFRGRGWAAFVLHYRIPADGYPHPVPMLDVQRAMRLVRRRAPAWKIDPERVGIIGFSAGGHLAATLATHFDVGQPSAFDPIDKPGCRPDFAVLVYPVITMEDGVTHPGSKENLLGPNPAPALVEEMSLEKQVTPQTPPTLVISTPADDLVPFENSQRMYQALQKAGVPSALHSYPDRPHGWGWGHEPDQSPPGWLDRVADWLAAQGFRA
jgi:acetyl esterase/lipase